MQANSEMIQEAEKLEQAATALRDHGYGDDGLPGRLEALAQLWRVWSQPRARAQKTC